MKYLIVYEVAGFPEEGGGTYTKNLEHCSLTEVENEINTIIKRNDIEYFETDIEVYEYLKKISVKPKDIVKTITLEEK